jgi:hypothetical protein
MYGGGAAEGDFAAVGRTTRCRIYRSNVRLWSRVKALKAGQNDRGPYDQEANCNHHFGPLGLEKVFQKLPSNLALKLLLATTESAIPSEVSQHLVFSLLQTSVRHV